jgi:hypothetical protein
LVSRRRSYLEDVFDYSPRTALERLRVAKELGELPELDAKLRDGEISYAAARELTRVMTPRTQEGLLTITGTAPDGLTFLRDGKRLVDRPSASDIEVAAKLRDTAEAEKQPSKFAAVATVEEAKIALRNLGYKARAAKEALDRAYAELGPDAEVPALVKKALEIDRRAADASSNRNTNEDRLEMARQALVQTGYPGSLARRAVESAVATLGPEADLSAFSCLSASVAGFSAESR